MALLKNGQFIDDPWFTVESLDNIPAGRPLLLSVAQWRQRRELLLRLNVPLGLRLTAGQSPEALADDLARFAMIALEFPKFTDGRSYSHARILRERYDFQGEVRATGNVLRDQLPLLQRCGFDTFAVPERAEGEDWAAAFAEISVVMQPAADHASAKARHAA
jgi:uncharacterized protein (DUF934 family)